MSPVKNIHMAQRAVGQFRLSPQKRYPYHTACAPSRVIDRKENAPPLTLRSAKQPSSRPADQLLQCLLEGYHPIFRPHPLGRQVEAISKLSPRQQMCYYEGKLFGGYLTFLLDRILADCCQPAVTAYLHTVFLRSVPPNASIRLHAWPEKIEGRKLYLQGTIQVPEENGQEIVDAVRANALFIRPKA